MTLPASPPDAASLPDVPDEPAPPSAVEVFHDVMAIVHLQRQLLFRLFAKQDLHPAQALCIRVLACHGELTQSELANALVLSRPSVTRLVQRMERGGLVTRRTDEQDQRQTRVALTRVGHDVQERLQQAMSEFTTATLARLPARDLADLARILPAWRRLAEEALE